MDQTLLVAQAAGPIAAEGASLIAQPAAVVILLLGVTLAVAVAMRSRLG